MGASIGNEGYLNNLIQCFDPANTQCWSGIGSVFYDLGRQKYYSSVIGTIVQSGSGLSSSLRMNGSGSASGSSCFYMVDTPIAITNYTIEAWIKPFLDNSAGIFTRRDETNASGLYLVATGTTNPTNPRAIYVLHNTGGNLGIVKNVLTANVWQQIVVTYYQPDNFVKCYVNGAGVGTSGPITALVTPSVSLRSFIGNFQISNPGGFGGNIGLVRMWDRDFSSTEVQTLYNLSRQRYGL
jgi:hypothetical protein